jgi:hypothetical protein
MTDQDIFEISEDSQILTETALNERIIEHPKFGRVRFCMPTLQIQKKIDAVSRSQKKMLLNAFDEVEDPDNPGRMRKIPAYQSREVLAKEYKEKGWWTDEHEDRLEKLSSQHITQLTELELLGFDSAESCLAALSSLRIELEDIFVDEKRAKVLTAIRDITDVVKGYSLKLEKTLHNAASTTEVDDLLESVLRQQQIYEKYLELTSTYAELLGLQNEQSSLFSDSWQDQLRYYLRLAQVHYCVQNADTGEPLWPSLDEMEAEVDNTLIRWVFDELGAFWQGLTEEMRDKLGKYDFIYGRSGSKPSSDDSPVQPESKPDGESPENEQTTSIEVTDTKEA